MGARLPGRLPAGGCLRAAAAGENRNGQLRAPLHPDGARLRVPVRAAVARGGRPAMRTRLIIAFIVVALLSALASAWFTNLILPYYHSSLPGWLSGVVFGPRQLMHLL